MIGYNNAGDRLLVGVVALNAEKTHVLLLQDDTRGSYVLPSGNWEIDENSMEAAQRVAWQVAGIVCVAVYALGIMKDETTQTQMGDSKAEYQYYEANVTAEEEDWPEKHKNGRRWATYSHAIALVEDEMMLEFLSRSTITRDSDMAQDYLPSKRKETAENRSEGEMGGPSNARTTASSHRKSGNAPTAISRGPPSPFQRQASSARLRVTEEQVLGVPVEVSIAHTRNISPPQMLRSALDTGEKKIVQILLVDHFDVVATEEFAWLHELQEHGYDKLEMVEVLLQRKDSPWIYVQPRQPWPLATREHHEPFCVHSGGLEIGNNAGSISNTAGTDQPGVQSFIMANSQTLRSIQELCGVAGMPPVRDGSGFGKANFEARAEGLTVSIFFDLKDPFAAKRNLAFELPKAFSNLCGAITLARENSLCCNSFTVLRLKHHHNGLDFLELQKIEISDIIYLRDLIQSLSNTRSPSEHLMQRIADTNDSFLCDGSLFIGPVNLSETLNYCSLVTQFLSLAFSSYVNAHVGPVDRSFLDTSLDVIKICGTGTFPVMTARLYRLSCMDGMLQQPVLAFEVNWMPQPKKQKEQNTYDLLATPEDLMDTWGPGQFVTSGSAPNGRGLLLSCILIGGGMIKATASDHNSVLHWNSDVTLPYGMLHGHFNSKDKVLIGGVVEVNKHCRTNHIERWSSFMGSLQNLATTAPYWQSTEFQASAAVMGQGELGSGRFQFNKTWTWHPGNSWKRQYLSLIEDELPFSELDRPWGLQVSACTGVARRVPLRVMLSDTMHTFAENLALPPGWSTLCQQGIIKALAEGGQILKQWYDDLYSLPGGDSLQLLTKRLIRHILLRLRDTGLDRDNKNLLVACPQDHGNHKPISMCMPVSCAKGSLWAKILQDSEDCATFAYMTSLCLESKEDKCQHAQPWQCPSLYTAVQESRTRDKGIVLGPHPWALEVNRMYWIGMPKAGLQAKAMRTAESPFMSLHISKSSIPLDVRNRLEQMGRMFGPKVTRLRERQIEGWPAEEVLIRSM